MSAIQVKGVPPELHDAVRRRALEEGMTVSQYVLAVLRRDLSVPSRREWLRRLASREPVEGIDIVREIDAARREFDSDRGASAADRD
jgi:hypothetical protein